jgi:hypothetical protein
MLEPLGMLAALKAVDEHFDAARYDSAADPPKRRRWRAGAANALYRLANMIQPNTEPSPRQHTCSPIGA